VIKYLSTKSQGRIPIIAVGGISTAADYHEKIEAGASLVQVYTGFIYEGPGMVKKLLA
jgi:dihydroorotate dehydrogenase